MGGKIRFKKTEELKTVNQILVDGMMGPVEALDVTS